MHWLWGSTATIFTRCHHITTVKCPDSIIQMRLAIPVLAHRHTHSYTTINYSQQHLSSFRATAMWLTHTHTAKQIYFASNTAVAAQNCVMWVPISIWHFIWSVFNFKTKTHTSHGSETYIRNLQIFKLQHIIFARVSMN